MARHLLLRHPSGPAHVIDVAVKWPRNHRHTPLQADAAPVRVPAGSAEVLAAYRRHRQRLADALRPEPTTPSSRAVAGRPFPRSATIGWRRWNRRLLHETTVVPAVRPAGADLEAHEEPSDLFAPDVLEAAIALYDQALPYHNARHALRTVACGERLLRACSQAGVRVDAAVVRLALLFHDAGYGTDPSTVGCPDAEAYAAAMARQVLTGRVPALVLDDVEAAILATRRATPPDTPEGRVVRAADLADLAAGYDTFAANSEALRVEHERLSGEPMSLAEWGRCVDLLLSEYLRERLWPLELLDDGSGRSGFHATAKANLGRYLARLR